LPYIDKAKILYTTSFFFVSKDAALKFVSYIMSIGKPLAFNLAAPFIILQYTEAVNQVISCSDYLFCNEHEAKAFALANKIEYNTLKDVAEIMAKWPKANPLRERVVVITQGHDPVIVCVAHQGEVKLAKEYAVPSIPMDSIVDTDGAGDSFVGGFLA
jgi:adenosine kinase